MVAAPTATNDDVQGPARQMSWAERAKASTTRSAATSQSPARKLASPTPSNTSTAPSDHLRSGSSSQQNGSLGNDVDFPLALSASSSKGHQKSGSDVAAIAPVAPSAADASAASADSAMAPAQQAATTKMPAVNVWKERMAAAQHQQAAKTTGVVDNSATLASSASSISSQPTGEASVPSPMNGNTAAPVVSIATTRIGPQVQSQPVPPPIDDTRKWPSPLDAERGRASLEEAAQKARTTDTSPSGTSSKSFGTQEAPVNNKGKKAKWVPIEADITFDAPLPTRYLREGEPISRGRARSQSNDRTSSTNVPSNTSGETFPSVPPTSATMSHTSAAPPAPPQRSLDPSRDPSQSSSPVLTATSLPARPLGGPPIPLFSNDGSPMMQPQAPASPRMNGILPPLSPSMSSTSPLTRSTSASSSGRGVGVSAQYMPPGRMEMNPFGMPPASRGMASRSPRGGRGDSRAQSPRMPLSGFGRGIPRGVPGGNFRGGRGGPPLHPQTMHQQMPPPKIGPPFFQAPLDAGAMYPMPYAHVPPMIAGVPMGQMPPAMAAQQHPFNMMPMMQQIPPAPIKRDYFPPLDATRFFLLGQVEYYMSPNNLAQDLFLRQQMDTEGWIDMKTVLTFKRISNMTKSLDLLRDTITLSPIVDVDYERYKFRAKQDWARWIMPGAKAAEPSSFFTRRSSTEEGNKSLSASEDGDGNTTSTTDASMTSPSLSSASDAPVKPEPGA